MFPKRILLLTLFFIYTVSAAEKEDFDAVFIQKFFFQEKFQLERIRFPLKCHLKVLKVLPDNSEIWDDSLSVIKKIEWSYTDFGFDKQSYYTQTYNNFEESLEDTNERVVKFRGLDSGENYSLFFKRIDGKWFLVKTWDGSL